MECTGSRCCTAKLRKMNECGKVQVSAVKRG